MRGEEGEGGRRQGGDSGVSRVVCLSALVPALASHPSLNHMSQSGQLHTHLTYTDTHAYTNAHQHEHTYIDTNEHTRSTHTHTKSALTCSTCFDS